jgi:hypothetical protein
MGQLIEKDEEQGAMLYRLAANQNFAHAQKNLGFCYQRV